MKRIWLVLGVIVLSVLSTGPTRADVPVLGCEGNTIDGTLAVSFNDGLFHWGFNGTSECAGATTTWTGSGISKSGPCVDPLVTGLRMNVFAAYEGTGNPIPYTWTFLPYADRVDAGDLGTPGSHPIDWSADYGDHSPAPTLPPYPYQPYGSGVVLTRLFGQCDGPSSAKASVLLEEYFYPGPLL